MFVPLQTAVVEEETEKAHDELSKQQLKETQLREKIQSLLEKADPFRVCTCSYLVWSRTLLKKFVCAHFFVLTCVFSFRLRKAYVNFVQFLGCDSFWFTSLVYPALKFVDVLTVCYPNLVVIRARNVIQILKVHDLLSRNVKFVLQRIWSLEILQRSAIMVLYETQEHTAINYGRGGRNTPPVHCGNTLLH